MIISLYSGFFFARNILLFLLNLLKGNGSFIFDLDFALNFFRQRLNQFLKINSFAVFYLGQQFNPLFFRKLFQNSIEILNAGIFSFCDEFSLDFFWKTSQSPLSLICVLFDGIIHLIASLATKVL
ncbi:hypothetical protein N1E17_04865 [Lacticaseibacillus paracasei]